MALFQSLADTNVGIVNEYILNTKGTVQGFGQTVNDFFDPTGGLPSSPDDGDRYISLATANGWIINFLEIYEAKTDTWNNIEPIPGTIAWVENIAPPNLLMWDPSSVAWVPLAAAGGVLAVPSTDNAIVRFDGVAGQVQDSGILITDTNDITGVQDLEVLGDTTIGGKLTVVGLIDPTGLELTPVAANPGLIPANTIWQDTTAGNRFTAGVNPLVLAPVGGIAANALASFASDTTLQVTGVTLDSVGNANGIRNLQINGNLIVGGTIVSNTTENINISNQFLQLNVGYDGPGQPSGIAMNYAATGFSTTSSGAFVPGVAGISNPVIATTAAGPLWVAGDLIQVTGSTSNDGFYEVQSHAANQLTVRGVGLVAAVADFVQTQTDFENTVGATIVGITVATLGTSSTGILEYSTGTNSSSLVSADVVLTENNQTINGTKTFTSPTSMTGGLQLATTGGTASTLDFYEEFSFTDTPTLGFSLVPITITGTRVGNQVALHFPPRAGVSGINGVLFLTNIGTFPSRWRPNANQGSIFTMKVYDGTFVPGDLTWDPTPGVEAWYIIPMNSVGFTAGADRGYSYHLSISYNIV